ncbi:unnamed protein product [marine sediment metagenome]|uniref:Uncharacterized protein n=1 Tax=marine sediment metagenome TaxID=412755 RepID=X1A9J9_9ZZZZ
MVVPLFNNKSGLDILDELIGDTEKQTVGVGDNGSPYGGTINGNTVSWENQYARLEVYPHTGQGVTRQEQYFNVLWKYPNNNIDVAFRFNFSLNVNLCDI